MSASLVGSEMCIRDSPSTTRLRSVATRWSCSATPGESLLTRPSGRATVSYTHLTLPTICSV
eukprot:6984770-Alexandrium_andersonii.AAC.1